MRRLTLLLLATTFAMAAHAEDGYQLWLRHAPLDATARERVLPFARDYLLATEEAPTTALAARELERGLTSLLGRRIERVANVAEAGIVLATPGRLAAIDRLDLPLRDLGSEGFVLRSLRLDGRRVVVIAANEPIGLLYGVFELLRHAQLDRDLARLDVVSTPRIRLRLLNHWDNLDRSVERGYAGGSIWNWERLPEVIDPRYTDYARANASIGINGAVLNNVNSNARILTPAWLDKVAAIANALRPWGMRVYLSARFSAPQEIGGLPTADPLDTRVRAWWVDKAREIYARIPDFGGFLIKANSEGQPGPGDFGRTHADGANLLAAAVAPHGGVVIWRAFVYSAINPEDRAKQAFSEFQPLDGRFAANVLVQAKNGPIDFQPREPVHPLFGAMPRTPLLLELQITKEYLGFATHLAYLGPLFQEVLRTDTYARGPTATVARVIDGSLHGQALTGIAGVANIGDARDWAGSDFNQANWYVFGRMAWDPTASAETIAREWLAQTFSAEPRFIDAAARLMLRSREAVVDYMTPLGLAHLMGTGHHYGPAPWVDDLSRPEWNPVYYHRADAQGIGFDRTSSGSDALAQYAPEVAAMYADPATTDERLLLWFHHLPWSYRLHSGSTLWEALVQHYDHGVAEIVSMQQDWEALRPFVDSERFAKARRHLEIQIEEATWWRDACLAYFMSVSGLPLPPGARKPAHDLKYYQSLSFPGSATQQPQR